MEPGKLIPLLLIGLYYLVTAYIRQQRKKEQENKQNKPISAEEVEEKEQPKPAETLQDVLRRMNEQARQEQQRNKQREQPKPKPQPQARQPKKLEPRVAPVMTSRIVENVKDENETHAYDTIKFEHTDSSLITGSASETQMPAFDLRQAVINSIILNRPEW
jgi:outer membrane biosynthesis protein TonB